MLNWKKIRNSKHKLCLDINKLLYVLTLGLMNKERGRERRLYKNHSIKTFQLNVSSKLEMSETNRKLENKLQMASHY